jgi:hypothetical protein
MLFVLVDDPANEIADCHGKGDHFAVAAVIPGGFWQNWRASGTREIP